MTEEKNTTQEESPGKRVVLERIVMQQVIDTMVLGHDGYRFRQNWLGKQILQIGDICEDWDTNTGRTDRSRYKRWRDADRYEAEAFLRKEMSA